MKAATSYGLTSIELLMAMVAASLLAVVAGTLIYYSHLAWRHQLAAVELHRDATFALDVIGHELRPAGRSGVTISTGRIEIATAGTPVAIYQVDGNLVLDRSVGVSGDEMILVRDHVNAFHPAVSGPGVAIRLHLQAGEENITMLSLTRWRN